MKQIILTVVAVVAVIGIAVVFGKSDDVQGVPSNHFYGKEDSTVTVVEYADFECPACAQFFPVLTQVKEIYKDEVRFEFRHYPLVQIHPNAQAAHRASEAAAKQGQFWEMHDLLFERQLSWRSNGVNNGVSSNNPTTIFEGYASELGLDIEQYKADAASSEVLATINADISRGGDQGVQGTPTIFINDERVETIDVATVESFSAVLDELLGKDSTDSDDNSDSEQTSE